MIKQWLQHPEQMGAEAVEELPRLISQYPYCAAFRMLYCIALANTHSTLLKAEIEKTACCIPDRTRLFMLINNGEHEWITLMKRLEAIQKEGKQMDDDDFAIIDRYLSQQHITDKIGSDNPLLSEISDFPLEQLEDCHPIQSDDEDNAKVWQESDEVQSDIIDQFLEADKQGELMVPQAEESEPSNPDPEPDIIREKAFLTESLARLYVKQHKFEQALAIFSQLNLQYSEKSNNFADQIRYLEKIIEFEKESDTFSSHLK